MTACWKCRTSVHAVEGEHRFLAISGMQRASWQSQATAIFQKKSSSRPVSNLRPFRCLCLADCAIRLSEKSHVDAARPSNSRSRPARRKAPARAKADAAGSDSSSEGSSDGGDPHAGEWLCQICSGERTEKMRFPYNRSNKQER